MARHGSLLLLLAAVASAELYYDQVEQALEEPYDPLPLYFGSVPVAKEELEPAFEEPVAAQNPEQQTSDFVEEKFGQVSGVGYSVDGNLVVFHRGNRVWDKYSFSNKNVFNTSLGPIKNTTIDVIRASDGKLLESHGANEFYMPHGLTIDRESNIWVTDVGRHQVIKLNKNFEPVLTLGEKLVPGDDNSHFCKPTDVAVASNGDFFVADGYCNSRVMKFDKNGKFLGSFGRPNTGLSPKAGQFFVPHSLALIEDMNMLCVADRDNERIQCFTAGIVPKGAHQRAVVPTGTFVTMASDVGKVMALREKNHYLVGITNTEPLTSNNFDLFIMDINSGKASTVASNIEDAHALAVNEAGQVFVGQLGPKEVVEFDLPVEPSFD